jgi:hypothetical protein
LCFTALNGLKCGEHNGRTHLVINLHPNTLLIVSMDFLAVGVLEGSCGKLFTGGLPLLAASKLGRVCISHTFQNQM